MLCSLWIVPLNSCERMRVKRLMIYISSSQEVVLGCRSWSLPRVPSPNHTFRITVLIGSCHSLEDLHSPKFLKWRLSLTCSAQRDCKVGYFFFLLLNLWPNHSSSLTIPVKPCCGHGGLLRDHLLSERLSPSFVIICFSTAAVLLGDLNIHRKNASGFWQLVIFGF